MTVKRTITFEKTSLFLTSNRFAYFCAFLIPVIILLFIFYRNQLYPFGDHTVMTGALFDRYLPFFSEYRRKIIQSESLLYTWNIAGGMNFLAIIGHYLASPFNLLLIPFAPSHFPLGISFLVLLRTGLSGLFMGVFIRKKEPKTHTALLLLFSTAYSLCGYAIAYFWAFMWMDAFVFLPLVIMGAYYASLGKRPVLYTIFLFSVFLSQFQVALYVFVFSLLMVVVFWFENKSEQSSLTNLLKTELRLLLSGVLSLGMASFLVWPTLRALNQSRIVEPIDYVQNFYAELTLFDVGTRLFYGAFPAVDYKMPNIYIPMAVLFLVPLFGLCTKLKLSERLASIAIALLLYVVMTSRVLNYWLDGFRFAQENNYKYAFLLSFMLLYMGLRVVKHLRVISKRQFIGVLFGFFAYIILYHQVGEVRPETTTIYLLVLLLIVSAILWWVFVTYEKKKMMISAFLLCLLCLELFASGAQGYAYLQNTFGFESNKEYRRHLEAFGQVRAQTEEPFLRNIFINNLTENDGVLFGVADIGGTYEYQYRGFTQFMHFLGMMNDSEAFDSHRFSVFTAHLMSVQNIYQRRVENIKPGTQSRSGPIYVENFDKKIDEGTDLYRLQTSSLVISQGISVDQDVYILPPQTEIGPDQWGVWLEYIGFETFYVPGNLNYLWGYNSEYRAEEGRIVSRFPGEADAFFDLGHVQNATLISIHSDQSAITRVRIIVPGRQADIFREWLLVGPAVVDTLSFFENEKYEATCRFEFVSIEEDGVTISASGLDIEKFERYLCAYEDRSFISEVWKPGHIEGSIYTDQQATLVLMIPYDEGWTALIEGKRATTSPSFGGLLGVPIDGGENEVVLKYTPSRFRASVILSVQSLLVFVLLAVFNPFGVYGHISKKNTEKDCH